MSGPGLSCGPGRSRSHAPAYAAPVASSLHCVGRSLVAIGYDQTHDSNTASILIDPTTGGVSILHSVDDTMNINTATDIRPLPLLLTTTDYNVTRLRDHV